MSLSPPLDEATLAGLVDSAGTATGIAAVVRDETARWAEEQELRRQVREGEGG